MRRSACLLTILGMTVQSAVGADSLVPGAEPATTPRTLQFFSAAKTSEEDSAAAPQKFQRNSVSVETAQDTTNPPSPPAGVAQLAGEGIDMTPGGTNRQLKPASSTDVVEENTGVVHASFDADGDVSESSLIQQVRGERFGAPPPFPGMEAAKTREASPSAPAPSLTDPISISSQPTSAVQQENPFAAAKVTAQEKAEPTQVATAAPNLDQSASVPAVKADAGPITPTLKVEWRKQSDINVGQECQCQLVVSNPGKSKASAVEVRAFFPATVRLTSAEPAPTQADKFLGWEFDELSPGEERTIQIAMIPLQRGSIDTRADVRFSSTATSSFVVAEPLLAVEIGGPEEVMVGESASQMVTVSNPGTGIATNVQVEAVIPGGLEHARGGRLLMDLGSLNPGESRSVRLALAAAKSGNHVVRVQARADAGLVRTADAEVSVIAPSLQAGIQGPGLRYLGRQGIFTLSVTNDGAVATDNVRVMHKIPDGFEFVGSDRGAQYDPATGLLTWFVGRLDTEQKASMKVTLAANKMGEFHHFVRATSENGSLSDAEMRTLVEGASALDIRVRDLDDPVEVGTETVYEVLVKNEGSAAAKNVGLACELAQGMTCLSAEGPAQHIVENGTVVFRTISELAPGESATYRVKVSADRAASLRFRARLSSESIAEPLTTEELTKFYGE